MTEETTQNATSEVAKTDTTFVPDWEKKAEKLEEMVKQGLGKQVGYKSVDGQVVEPILLTEEQNGNTYPIAIDKPVGFIAPAYSWFGEQRGYYETAPAYQGKKIQELTQSLNEVVKDQEQIKQDQVAIKQEKETDKNKDSQQMKFMVMLLSQVSIMSKQVSDLNQKLTAQPSAPVNTENAAQPTQSTATTQPNDPVKTENATQPTQSTATTQPSVPAKDGE